MKKISLLILTLFIGFCALGQNTVTLESGTVSVVPQFRYKAITPDSLNHLWYYNPLTGKYNRLFTATEINKLFTAGAFVPNSRQIFNGFGILGSTQLNADITKRVDTTVVTSVNKFNTTIGSATAAAIAGISYTGSNGIYKNGNDFQFAPFGSGFSGFTGDKEINTNGYYFQIGTPEFNHYVGPDITAMYGSQERERIVINPDGVFIATNSGEASLSLPSDTSAAVYFNNTGRGIDYVNLNIAKSNANTLMPRGYIDGKLGNYSKLAKVYVMSGESNAAGAVLGSQITPADTITRQNVFILNNNTRRLEKLKIGTNNNLQGGATGRFGWELQLAQSTPSTDTIYIIKTGISGQNIAKLIDSLPHTLALIDTAMKQIRALNKTPVPYILYSQGINDSPQNYPITRRWKNNTLSYIKTIRSHVGYAPVFMTKFDPAIVFGYLNPAIDSIASYHDNFTYTIPTLGLPTNAGEPQHWNRSGDSTIVLRMLASITQNIGPVAGAPNLYVAKAGTPQTYAGKIMYLDSVLVVKNEAGYATADQTTNTSYVTKEFTGNGYDFLSKSNGTGIAPNINIGINGQQQLQIKQGVLDKFTFTGGSLTASSGSQSYLTAFPTVNQTSTAGYTGLNLTAYLQGVGSGANNLFALRTSTAANGGGTVTDRFTVNGSGLVYSGGGYVYGTTVIPANHGIHVAGAFIGVDRSFGYTFTTGAGGSARSFISSNATNDINFQTSSGGSFSFLPAGTQKEWINAQGHGFGTGLTNPQAQAHFSGSTVSAYSEPIKFSTGVARQTTLEQGAINWDGTRLYVASGGTPVNQTFAYLTDVFSNPMTSVGDIIVGGTSGTPTRLAVGGANTVLHGGSTPSYSAIATGDIVNSAVTVGKADTTATGFATRTYAASNLVKNGSVSYLQRLSLTGTAGNGYLDLISQSVSPSSLTGHLRLYSDSLNRLSWKNSTYRRTIQVPMTTDVTIRMPYLANPTLVDSTQAAAKFLRKDGGNETIIGKKTFVDTLTAGSANVNGVINLNSSVRINSFSNTGGNILLNDLHTVTEASGLKYVSSLNTLLLNEANPNSGALLTASSTTKGIMLPRMTSAQMNAISVNVEYSSTGTYVDCSNCTPAGLYRYSGSAWAAVGGTGGGTITGGVINWPGTIYTTPTTATTPSGILTFTPALATQSANTIFAGPSTGSAAVPTFRALVSADIPAIDLSTSAATGILAAGRFPALTGDATTTAGSLVTTLKNTGTPGTYQSVTTDAQGRVTGGTNPTTLAGYNITDAVPASRTININGTTQDLSTNRTYTLNTANVSATTNKQYVTDYVAANPATASPLTIPSKNSKNLFNQYQTTANYGVFSGTGGIGTFASPAKLSNKIFIGAGVTYTISQTVTAAGKYLAYFNSSGTQIGSSVLWGNSLTFTATTPATTAYVYFTAAITASDAGSTRLGSLQFELGSSATSYDTAEEPINIIMFGTSISLGFNVTSPAVYFGTTIQNALQPILGRAVNIINAGISGNTSIQMLSRLPALLTANPNATGGPNIVFIEVPINDTKAANAVNTSPYITETNMRSMIALIQGAGMIPIVVSEVPIDPTNPYTADATLDVNRWQGNNGIAYRLAKELNIRIAEVDKYFGRSDITISPDLLHPSTTYGQWLLSEAYLNALYK